MKPICLATAGCVIYALAATAVSVEAAGPEVRGLVPSGAQRGTTIEAMASGNFPKWPVQAWVDRPGIVVTPGADKGKLKLAIDADAVPGVAWLRLFDADTSAPPRPLVIGMQPEIDAQAVLRLAAVGFATAARRESGGEAHEVVGRVEREGVWTGVRAGVRAVADSPTLHHPLALMVVANLVYGAMQVLMLVAAWKLLGMSEGGYGALCAGLGAGAFAALLVVDRVGKLPNARLALSGAVLVSAVPLALLSIATDRKSGV